MPPSDLIAELTTRASQEGANTGLWPGLTIYRYTKPTQPPRQDVQLLSIGIVAQGRTTVTTLDKQYPCGQSDYLILSNGLHFQTHILQASPSEPFLSVALQLEPTIVRKVAADMLDRRSTPVPDDDTHEQRIVSALDDELHCSVVGFLRSLSAAPDRRVLAPLRLQEMVYRLLQREQSGRILSIAAEQSSGNPVDAALTYLNAHLASPLTVTKLAEQVGLGTSAFTRSFRKVTGRSPYQFIKEARLNHARELLLQDRSIVADVARKVGYASVSHFTKEFRIRFGTTPKQYADEHALRHELRATRSDTR